MEGTLTFEQRNGQAHGVLAVKNDSDKTLWIPRSPEAINFSVDGGLPSLHVDFSLCAFPTDYVRLKPTETHRYVQRLPEDAKGQVEMEVWAPWRASDGQSLVDAQMVKAALRANEVLVEKIVGVGQFE